MGTYSSETAAIPRKHQVLPAFGQETTALSKEHPFHWQTQTAGQNNLYFHPPSRFLTQVYWNRTDTIQNGVLVKSYKYWSV